jgi:N-acetylmuramoyl-L-alanine amidase
MELGIMGIEYYEIPAHISNYTKGRKQNIKYIVVHYTANDGDTARNNGKYFSQPNRNASAHYFVDENEIIQSVKDTNTAWHCGAKSYKHPKCRNDNSVGIEMCSEKDDKGQYYINQATQNRTIRLIKVLMGKYNIPIENVLRHYDVTGKICPEPFVRNQVQWLDFKKRLSEEKEGGADMIYNYMDENMPDWAKPTIQKLIDKGALKGNEKGELMLTDVMLRIFVANDRMGLYDR